MGDLIKMPRQNRECDGAAALLCSLADRIEEWAGEAELTDFRGLGAAAGEYVDSLRAIARFLESGDGGADPSDHLRDIDSAAREFTAVLQIVIRAVAMLR